MSEPTNQTDNKPATGYDSNVPDPKPVETPEQKVDDFGYDTQAEPEKPPVEDVKPDPKPEDTKVEDPATGYGDDPEKKAEETKPEEKTPEEKPEAPKEEAEVDEVELGDTEGLLETEVKALKELAKEAKLSKDATKALVDFKKKEVAKYSQILKDREEAFKKEIIETKKAWIKELRDDPDFGGESFGANVNKVEKLIKEFMPNTKKELTKSGTMLPPSVMRDLYNLSKSVYGSENLVHGEPTKPKVEDKDKKQDPLDFYK